MVLNTFTFTLVGSKQKYIYTQHILRRRRHCSVSFKKHKYGQTKCDLYIIMLLLYYVYYCYTIVIIYICGEGMVYRRSTNLLRIRQIIYTSKYEYIFCIQ